VAMSKRIRKDHRNAKLAEATNILIDKVVGIRPPENMDGTIRYLKYRVNKIKEH